MYMKKNHNNIGIFIILKFIHEIFGKALELENSALTTFIFFLSFTVVLYSSFKIYKERNLKNISVYFCLSNLLFIIDNSEFN